MRKLLITVLAAVCMVCLGLAAACKEPNYYVLTYSSPSGVTINCDIQSGYEVKENYIIQFTLKIEDDIVETPEVKANDTVLQADDNGVYSFKITENTEITVSGIYRLSTCSVTFDRQGDNWVWFNSDSFDPEQGVAVTAGDQVSFTVGTSVYYGEKDFTVLANTEVVRCDDDGVYTFTVTDDTTITLVGISPDDPDDSFIVRNDGKGTESDPYRIRRPIDLFEMSALIGNSFYQASYYNKYYSLENDIDLKGEQLFIIGDGMTSYFSGNFNGNGHKISNYYIADTEIDQTYFTEVFMPYLGLFGYAMATTQKSAEIYDLTLENFTINIDAAKWEAGFVAGGVVGSGVGVNITNCSVSGTIIADSDDNYFGFIGGIIGDQSSYNDGSICYYSTVRSCSSDVDIIGESGYLYAAGGITAMLTSYDARTAALVLNSYSTGNVIGAMYAGGIVGVVGPYGSVKGCYATGNIEADNYIGLRDGYEDYAYAYSGGIAGYLDYDSIISDCFFTGATYANSIAFGSQYAKTDAFAGYRGTKSPYYLETRDALVINCYSKADKVTIDDNFIKNTLGWDVEDWTFNGDGCPVINQEEVSKSFTVTVNLGSEKVEGKDAVTLNVSDIYIPMSYWYIISDGLPEFLESDNGLRTYGYFFDAALTQKVPYSYVPTSDITIYAGFADYNEVAGEYYFKSDKDVSIVLGADGTLTYRNGAVLYPTVYIYDGATILLGGNPAFEVSEIIGYDELGNNVYFPVYYTGMATLSDGVLTVINMKSVSSTVDGTNSIIYLESAPLVAVRKDASFSYGVYYAQNGVNYTFYENGTGLIGNENFTYTINGDALTITRSSGTLTAKVVNGVVTEIGGTAVTALDRYAGVWEKSASSHRQYTFDGKGGWSYEYFGYGSDGKKITLDSATGSYTVDADGAAVLDNGVKAVYDEESGFIAIGGETYYTQNSFVGTWRYSGQDEPVEITLNGIGSDGYGMASVRYYGSYNQTIEAYYAIEIKGGVAYISICNLDTELVCLTYDSSNNTLKGSVYSLKEDDIRANVAFCLYDDYKGVWTCEELGTVEFNGLGNYNLEAMDDAMPVRSSLKINDKTVSGGYTLENGTLTGSFTYNGEVYEIEYDEENAEIIVTVGDATFRMERAA